MPGSLHQIENGFTRAHTDNMHSITDGFVRANVQPGGGGDALLLETGDYLLLETGDKLLLE
jgi:hypothetical protein